MPDVESPEKLFEPVAEITRAADSINNGMDLSKRLPQGEAKDELYGLTETLNRMIERLENAFQAEKKNFPLMFPTN